MASIKVQREELDRLFRHLLERVPPAVELDTDYYLVIDTAEWERVGEEPEPGIGSLHDDWRELRRALDEPDRFFSAVDIERFASVLRAIGQSFVS